MVFQPVFAVTHRPLDQIEDEVILGALHLDDAIIELADQDRVPDIVLLLSVRARLAPDDALRLLAGAPEQPVALLCRAAGVGLNGYSAVLRMRRRALKVMLGGPAALLHAYLGLTALSGNDLTRHIQSSLAETGA